MKAGALIDVNHLAFKHIDKADYYLAGKDYDLCLAELHGVNACLPHDHRIEFNTDKFKELTDKKLEVVCKSCGETYNRDKLTVWDMLLPLDEQIFSTEKFVKAWTCEKCKASYPLSDSRMILKEVQSDFFIGVVPEPPQKNQNLSDRTTFHIKFKSWYGMVKAELTAKITKLRWDYHKEDENESLGEMIMEGLESKY